MQHEHTPLDAWIEGVQAGDVESVAHLYHPRAVTSFMRTNLHGRDAIRDHLWGADGALERVRVGGVHVLRRTATTMRFETRVETPLGHAILRHDWRTKDGMILDHAMQILAFRRTDRRAQAALAPILAGA